MTDWPNAHGRPSFYDLDESWYRYMKADRKERIKMCEEALNTEALVLGIFAVIGVVLGILGLVRGWF